jgi:hypothetical protein
LGLSGITTVYKGQVISRVPPKNKWENFLHIGTLCKYSKKFGRDRLLSPTLLDGSNVRLNCNIESDLNVNWIKFKNFLSFY